MMGRRGFLKLLGVGVLGLSLALRRPEQPIDFAPETNDTGMAVRFIRNWDEAQSKSLQRIDVMYGYATIRPEFAVRVTHEPSFWERLMVWRS